jgi:hypothetical protein
MKHEHVIIDGESVDIYLDASKGEPRLLVLLYLAVFVTGFVKTACSVA